MNRNKRASWRRLLAGIAWCLTWSQGSLAGDVIADNEKIMKDSVTYGSLNVMKAGAPTNGPRLYYSFDTPPSGNSISDESLNGNLGAVYGATCTTGGQVAGAFDFDDLESNHVEVAYGSCLQLTNSFTLAAWIYPHRPSNPLGPGIVSKGADPWGVEYGIDWYNGNIDFFSTAPTPLTTTGGPVPTNTWSHVAAVLEGSGANQAKIYVNGAVVQQGQLPLPYVLSGIRPLYVGRWRGAFYFKGLIDEVRVFDRALSLEEVQGLYSNTATFLMTNTVLRVDNTNVHVSGQTTIQHLVRQGDVEMGVYTNGP